MSHAEGSVEAYEKLMVDYVALLEAYEKLRMAQLQSRSIYSAAIDFIELQGLTKAFIAWAHKLA